MATKTKRGGVRRRRTKSLSSKGKSQVNLRRTKSDGSKSDGRKSKGSKSESSKMIRPGPVDLLNHGEGDKRYQTPRPGLVTPFGVTPNCTDNTVSSDPNENNCYIDPINFNCLNLDTAVQHPKPGSKKWCFERDSICQWLLSRPRGERDDPFGQGSFGEYDPWIRATCSKHLAAQKAEIQHRARQADLIRARERQHDTPAEQHAEGQHATAFALAATTQHATLDVTNAIQALAASRAHLSAERDLYSVLQGNRAHPVLLLRVRRAIGVEEDAVMRAADGLRRALREAGATEDANMQTADGLRRALRAAHR